MTDGRQSARKQPARQGFAAANAAGPRGQLKKGNLEGIFGVVVIERKPTRDAEN